MFKYTILAASLVSSFAFANIEAGVNAFTSELEQHIEDRCYELQSDYNNRIEEESQAIFNKGLNLKDAQKEILKVKAKYAMMMADITYFGEIRQPITRTNLDNMMRTGEEHIDNILNTCVELTKQGQQYQAAVQGFETKANAYVQEEQKKAQEQAERERISAAKQQAEQKARYEQRVKEQEELNAEYNARMAKLSTGTVQQRSEAQLFCQKLPEVQAVVQQYKELEREANSIYAQTYNDYKQVMSPSEAQYMAEQVINEYTATMSNLGSQSKSMINDCAANRFGIKLNN